MADARAPAIIVTNFNRNFTGVSATAAAVLREQAKSLDVSLCGYALPGCPAPLSTANAIRRSREAIAAGRPVIWHVRRNSEMLRALVVRDLLRLPIKIVFTSAAQRRHSALPRWLISRMDAVIATTELAASFVPHVRAVVPHGVDTEWFAPAADRTTAWRESGFLGQTGIAAIGRIRPEKGTDRFVEAMLAALPQQPNVVALVIGRAAAEHREFERALIRRVREAGLAERVLFVGELEPDRLRRLYPALSLLVALPRYEGFGMTVPEAMASGVPVVASDVGHFSTFIGDGQAGSIVSDNDVAAAIDGYLSDPLRTEMAGAAARARAINLFSVDAEVSGIEAVYREIVAKSLQKS